MQNTKTHGKLSRQIAKELSIRAKNADVKKAGEYKQALEKQMVFFKRHFCTYFEDYDDLQLVLEKITSQDVSNIIANKAQWLQEKQAEATGDRQLVPKDYDSLRRSLDAINILLENTNVHVGYNETVLCEPHEVICPICGKPMVFEYHGKSNKYRCLSGDDISVTCHPYTAVPAGIPATAKTRKLRQSLHILSSSVFKGSRNKLYSYLAMMLDREFNDHDGHIGSMNETECEKSINMFRFIRSRVEQSSMAREDAVLERHFLSHASIDELRAYYVLVKCRFLTKQFIEAMRIKDANVFYSMIVPMVRKGIPVRYWNMNASCLNPQMLSALKDREALSVKLAGLSPKDLRQVVYF